MTSKTSEKKRFRLFGVLRTSLLILCVLIVVLWVSNLRSWWWVSRYSADREVWSLDDGALFLHDGPRCSQPGSGTGFRFLKVGGRYPCSNQLKFGERLQWKCVPYQWSTLYPLWPGVVVVLVPTLFLYRGELWRFGVWLARTKRRRIARGHCTNCDYNLTGNVSGVCPECGTAVPEGLKRRRVEFRRDQR